MISSPTANPTHYLRTGSEENPAPVTYTLRSLDYFVTDPYLRASLPQTGSCSAMNQLENNDTSVISRNVWQALGTYSVTRSVDVTDLYEIQRNISVEWPTGTASVL